MDWGRRDHAQGSASHSGVGTRSAILKYIRVHSGCLAVSAWLCSLLPERSASFKVRMTGIKQTPPAFPLNVALMFLMVNSCAAARFGRNGENPSERQKNAESFVTIGVKSFIIKGYG